MAYGNSTPPEGAPVPSKELIGATLVVGLISVLSISRHGSYVIAFAVGRQAFDLYEAAIFALNLLGFVGSLWLLALRRWAWTICLVYLGVEVVLRGWHVYLDLAPLLGSGRGADPVGALGEFLLMLVLIVILGYLAGADTREMLARRAAYTPTPTPTT